MTGCRRSLWAHWAKITCGAQSDGCTPSAPSIGSSLPFETGTCHKPTSDSEPQKHLQRTETAKVLDGRLQREFPYVYLLTAGCYLLADIVLRTSTARIACLTAPFVYSQKDCNSIPIH